MEFADQGIDALGKIFHIADEKKMTDIKFVRAILLESAGSIVKKEGGEAWHHETNGVHYHTFFNPKLTISFELFPENKAMFVNIFCRVPRTLAFELTRLVKNIQKNMEARSVNFTVLWRP